MIRTRRIQLIQLRFQLKNGKNYRLDTPTFVQFYASRAGANKIELQAGYKEGITAGKQSQLQTGFDQGFSQAAPSARQIGSLRGISNGLLSLLTTSAGSKHGGFLPESITVTLKDEFIIELRELVRELNKFEELGLLGEDQEAVAHSKLHNGDNGESLEAMEKREMREIEGLLGGAGMEGVKIEKVEVDPSQQVQDCQRRLAVLLSRCGLENVLGTMQI